MALDCHRQSCQLSDLRQRHTSNEVIRSASDDINGVLALGRASLSFLTLAIENCWTAQCMVEGITTNLLVILQHRLGTERSADTT